MAETFLSQLINAGADAQSNLFSATFFIAKAADLLGSDAAETYKRFTVRLAGFTPPETHQEDYTVNYGPAYIDRPKAFVNVTRNFPLKFRIDSNWELYKDLCKIQNPTMSPSKAWAGNDTSNIKMDITISAYKGGSNNDGVFTEVDGMYMPEDIYKFTDCWILSITPPTFTNGTSSEATVEATIGFKQMIDGHNSILIG